jgi:hypothetical protein
MRGLIAAGLLASCATPGGKRPAEEGVPAVIVTDALGVEPLLADDALTRGGTLIIERRHLEGRERALPEKFQLLKIGERCVIVHERTGQRSPLVQTKCTEAAQADGGA